jgi:hypothetical protein
LGARQSNPPAGGCARFCILGKQRLDGAAQRTITNYTGSLHPCNPHLLVVAHASAFQAHSGLMAQQSTTTSRATLGSTGLPSKPEADAHRSFT